MPPNKTVANMTRTVDGIFVGERGFYSRVTQNAGQVEAKDRSNSAASRAWFTYWVNNVLTIVANAQISKKN